jgi:putative DNA primase/helicase
MTQIAAVPPGGTCEQFLSLLDWATGGDTDMQNYLQRVAGYAATGDTSEQAFFFFHGHGGNGKTLLMNAIARALGSYAKSSATETFTASRTDRHPTELAHLRGARLVTASETEELQTWAESRIKSVTGGEKIVARRMREDPIEFVPTFKLVIMGNHRPSVRSPDESIRRRLHFVPFKATIGANEKDKDLPQKLLAEMPGILGWIIEGARKWQTIGLAPPQAITAATQDYLEEEDLVGQWIADRAEKRPGAWTRTRDLYGNWRTWADQAGVPPETDKWLKQALEKRGYTYKAKNNGRGFLGLCLRS